MAFTLNQILMLIEKADFSWLLEMRYRGKENSIAMLHTYCTGVLKTPMFS